MTFCGAVHAIVHAGLRPVFVDCDETLVMSVEDTARAARESGARAMVVQHMGGYPAPVDELAAAAGIGLDHVVEDAAHGLGGARAGRRIGTLSRATCFSFYATKNLALGEGGAITTDDAELATWLRSARLHGMSGDAWRRYQPGAAWRYDVAVDGLKANMTDLLAALGRVQLRHLDHWQRRRAEVFALYDELLADVPGITLAPRPLTDEHAWHLYVVRIAPPFPLDRDAVAAELARLDIGTSVHFIPAHQLSQFASIADRPLPAADRFFPELLSLPLHAELTDDQVHRVCDAIRTMHENARRGEE
jgi:perosamine synthetase